MSGSRGGTGKSQKYRFFLAILVWIPWKITKLPSQHSLSGYHWPASKTPFKWRFAGGRMMACFFAVYGSSILPSSTEKKKCCQSWTPLTKLWIPAYVYIFLQKRQTLIKVYLIRVNTVAVRLHVHISRANTIIS